MRKEITFKSGEKEINAYIATPEAKGAYPGLVLIHEIWGLTEHIKDVANRYADQGFFVLAPDILSDTGISEKMSPTLSKDLFNPEKRHEAQARMRAVVQPISTKEFSEDALKKLVSSVDYLLQQKGCTGNVGVLGFCFGGTYSFHLAVNEKRLKACVTFYGQPPQPLDLVEKISCPVLSFYGEKDENLMKSLPQLEEAMKRYNKNFTYKVYENTGHAFFNDTNEFAYNKEAAEDAWKTSLAFLRKNLGK